MIDKIEDNLKKFHILLLIALVVVFQFIFPIADHSANDKTIDKILINHDSRILNLENGYLGNRDILLELRFNLREHMRMAGTEYQDNTDVINRLAK